MLRRLAARVFWALSGWKLVTEPAPDRPTVLVGAPHTSNWDFVFMLAIAWRLSMNIRWLGKKSLFRGWRGPIMRAWGGIPVDRDDPGRVVDEVVGRIRAGDVFGLVVTPDGTRRGHTHWKSGFYRIAREARMPVTLGFVDRTTKTSGLGPTFELSGDVGRTWIASAPSTPTRPGFAPSFGWSRGCERRALSAPRGEGAVESALPDRAETRLGFHHVADELRVGVEQ